MPNLSPLAALFRLRPDRAADYLAAKGFKLSGPYWEMDGPQHSHLFTVANLAKLDVLQDLRSAVQQALDDGQTERWFRKQLIESLQAKGWWGGKDGSLRRLQTIYRTNLQAAYMAGRHRQAVKQVGQAPWAQYLAVRDQRTRPAHAALHGQVFRLDSPAWAVIAPTNGYNCRCRARYLSDLDLEEKGLKPAEDIQILEREPPGKRPVDPLTGASPERWIQRGVSVPSKTNPGERDILWADPGWDNIPGSDGAERMLVDRLLAKATDLGDGVRMAVQDGFAAQNNLAVITKQLHQYAIASQGTLSERIAIFDVKTGESLVEYVQELELNASGDLSTWTHQLKSGSGFSNADMFDSNGNMRPDNSILHMHTHPVDHTFSDGDWRVFARSTIDEMRVITPSAEYRIKKTKAFNALPWQKRTPTAIDTEYNKIIDIVFDENPDATIDEMIEEATKRMSNAFGIEFYKINLVSKVVK